MKSKSGRVAFTALLAALALALSFLEGLLPPSAHDAPRGQAGAFQPGHHVRCRQPGPAQRLVFGGVQRCVRLGDPGGHGRADEPLRRGYQHGGDVAAAEKGQRLFGGGGGVRGPGHNAAQLCVAYFLTSTSVLFYVPFLLVFGVLTGLLTGLVLKLTLKPLERLQKYLGP